MRRFVPLLALGLCAASPLLTSHATLLGYAQTGTTVQGDEFNSAGFTAPFVVKCGHLATGTCSDPQSPVTWSLNSAAPGYLRIETQPGSLVGSDANASNNARNLVLQPAASTDDYTVTASLTFPSTGVSTITPVGQTAGIIVYQDDDHFIYLGRSFAAANIGQPQLEFRQEDGTTDLVTTQVETGLSNYTVYLRLVKTGNVYQGYYSYDNVTFNPMAPALPPTATPSATGTATTTATATATETLTATATATQTPVETVTPGPTATSTPEPTGYVANYANPQVGVFAWGGTDAAAASSVLPADFDWFRVGANSQTPVPTATETSAPSPTSTVTETATITTTPPPPPTDTPVASSTPVSTDTPTPTDTPAPTETSPPPATTLGFSYVSVWYHTIRIGHTQHVQIQAKNHSRQGIWTTIRFATGKQIRYWQQTNNRGFWQASFRVPAGTIGRRSHQASVTFQLWKGSRTTKRSSEFNVIR